MHMTSQLVRVLLLLSTPTLLVTCLRAGDIHTAAASGDLNKVRALLEADPTLLESKDEGRSTPLLSACAAQRADVANFLLDKGADVKARDRFQMTPLHRASYSYIQAQDLALIRRLIDNGADVNARGYNGLIPLHQAAQSGGIAVAMLLMDHGADVNAYDKYTGAIGTAGISGTVLQVAINFNPKEEMAVFLVERGAKLNRRDTNGNTELHLAALKGYAQLARILIEHGADVHAVS
jgi:ankyrin repeat protein